MGEDHVDLDEPVILVEGQFDYAKIRVHYDNVLSGQTTQVQQDKINRLGEATEIITIFDNGVGGDKGRDRITKHFTTIPVTHLNPPEPFGDLGQMPDDAVRELLEYVS
jgi:5S rRNA maturation endonuclease (ribonuclease M5)